MYLANNFYGLWVQRLLTDYKFAIPLAAVYIALVYTHYAPAVFLIVILFAGVQSIGQLIFINQAKKKSRKLGFKILMLVPGPAFILKRLLLRKGIKPGSNKFIELHIDTTRKYKLSGYDKYLEDLKDDAELLAKMVTDKNFNNTTFVFNTFNRRALEYVKTELTNVGISVSLYKNVVLTRASLWSYRPKRHKKVQKRMFGKILSNKRVDLKDAWDVLIFKGG